ncbi:ATPase involved in chromosome partitioning-like protein [Rippkaea orientalis PCC 8801]|uniref:ATPase involved in chromosome partitioning-like protein n=1 Tax=Rippkaea orientalis (strain PCC 8801 / RF-1) TaxID=41431 RepID=B7JUW5_RIPO1|nr:AAA family ATPase [Rippkaea orientalis]ACK66817.1 ATPase involved in chromosome partitioning-like protein [Rippkaea orientalis PCC 8801]
MKVITFYSYKGGVGRTLTAANFAVYLAKLGLTTVVIDFDLEAPGIDAKFNLPKFSENQLGLLDYILQFQETNQDPNNLKEISCKVPFDETENKTNLWLIPAGQYLSEDYYHKLNKLDWGLIFSDQRDGVAFFQQFLKHLEQEFKADFVIIDSRTGITEIAGLCTQQLADEVVMLSSMSSESIRVTKHIKQLIENSQVASTLGKSIDVKVVVSRIPQPDNLFEFKEKCCQTFETADNKLFFIFSCPALELEEFLAINDTKNHEELVNNYINLFYGLNLEISDQNIITQIQKVSSRILLLSPEEAEQEIIKLASLYPHPEVYRTAMRFFRLRHQENKIKIFGWKLLDLLPDDEEGQNILGNQYLDDLEKIPEKERNHTFLKNALKAIEPLYLKKQLNQKQTLLYSQVLYDLEKYQESFDIALNLAENKSNDMYTKRDAYQIALNCAKKLDKEPYKIQKLERIVNKFNHSFKNEF